MSCQVLGMVENDQADTIQCTWEGFDITGYTITLNVEREDGSRFDVAATVTDVGPPAVFYFQFGANELTRGTHKAAVKTVNGNGKALTFSGLTLDVVEDLTPP